MKLILKFVLFFLHCFAGFSFASNESPIQDIAIEANEVSFDIEEDLISASGMVVIKQILNHGKNRSLFCDKIQYRKSTGEISLYGDAILQEPSGELIAAKNIEFDAEFKKAVIHALLVVLKDNSKIRAKKGEKHGNHFIFDEASYTPCYEYGCKAPLWDLYAEKVIYDEKKKQFIYKNARLRIKGKTVFYIPYFFHPSFEVRRQSGFLAPVIMSNSSTGLYIGTPYYVALSPDKDLKLTPFLNFKSRGFASAKYRQAFKDFDMELGSSILTKARSNIAEENKTRWHLFSSLNSYSFNNKRFSFIVNRASDVTYMLKYPVSDGHSEAFLGRKYNESKISYDSFDKNYLLSINSYSFQIPDAEKEPLVFPHFRYQYEKNNIQFINDSLFLTRKSSNKPEFVDDFFRTTSKVAYDKEVHKSGCLFNIHSGIGLDIRDKAAAYPSTENKISGFYPFLTRFSDKNRFIWGPKTSISSIKSLKNRKNIVANEDSLFNSFSDLNIFALNRYGMFDKIEEGDKLSYGMEGSLFSQQSRVLNGFIGTTKTFKNREKKLSKSEKDVLVGRFLIKPYDFLSFRTRMYKRGFEGGVNIERNKTIFGIGYMYDANKSVLRENIISQIGFSFGYEVFKAWKAYYSKIINFQKNNGKRNLADGFFMKYQDECFSCGFGIYRSGYEDKDIKPNTGFIISIGFKNLGNIAKPIEKYLYDTSIGKIE